MLPDMFRLVGDLSCLGHSAELAVTESGRAEAQLILIVFAAQLKSCPEFGQLSGSEPAGYAREVALTTATSRDCPGVDASQ